MRMFAWGHVVESKDSSQLLKHCIKQTFVSGTVRNMECMAVSTCS